MTLLSIPARFDGEQVLLDEPVQLLPNARLIVTVLTDSGPDREAFLQMSSRALDASFGDDEVEDTVSDLARRAKDRATGVDLSKQRLLC